MKKILLLIFAFSLSFANFQNDSNLKVTKFSNGFTYYFYQNHTPKDTIDIYLYVNAGSIDERKNERGIAHFTEHMVFNGSRDFSKNELISALESLGVKLGADLNAMTSFDRTVYKLNIKNSKQNIQTAINVMENMAFYASFNKDELETEKGVIISEDRARNDPSERIFEQTMPMLYNDSIYQKRLPIGDMDIIKNATPQLLREFYERNYQPQNMSLIVVGDAQKNVVDKIVKNSFANVKNTRQKDRIDDKIEFFDELMIFSASDKEAFGDNISVSFESKVLPVNSRERFKDEIINSYIAELFDAVVDRYKTEYESPFSAGFYSSNIQEQKMLNSFSIGVKGGDFKKSFKEFFGVINFIKENGFFEDDFEAIKKYFQKQNELTLAKKGNFENSVFVNSIISYVDSGEIMLSSEDDFKLTKELLDEISLSDINAKFNEILSKKGVLIQTISKKEIKFTKSEIEKFMQTKAINLNSPKELPNSLLGISLTTQKPIKTALLDGGIKVFEFENGSKIMFKQNSYKKDEVSFSFVKKGGFSNVDDLINLQFGIMISNDSGIGEFNSLEVDKITAGETFNFKKFATKNYLGFKGETQNKDLENFLKAFYVDFLNPKIDKISTQKIKATSINVYENNKNNPEYKFRSEFNDFLYKNNKKMKFATSKEISKLEIPKMKNALDENFKNASEYSFIFVGDIDEKVLVELAGKYIANLPSYKSHRNIDDDGVRSVDGVHKFTKNYLNDQKAIADIYIKSFVTLNEKEKISLDASNYALNLLMRESIREEKGLVYGIYSTSIYSRYPRNIAFTNISFTCEPGKDELIVDEVKKIIAIIKLGNFDDKILNDYKNTAKVSLAKSYQEPSFWENMMVNFAIYNEPIKSADIANQLIESINKKDIIDIANKVYSDENFIISVVSQK
ncbi:MAG: insulinase family protein [Campylobacter sp.]|nr:insulinase family protein [Campylobacter sp.]